MALHPFSTMANYMLLGAVNSIRKDLKAGATMKEPDYLAAIVTKFPPLMNTMWGNAKYGGCYIHQKPYVTTVAGDTCEAGDLLVLCRKTVDGKTRINAALFQLKFIIPYVQTTKYNSTCTRSGDHSQWDARLTWPSR